MFGGNKCRPCPLGCSICIPNIITNKPQCTKCTSPAMMGTDGICFYCNPICLTCARTSNNCTSCESRYNLKTFNNTGQCIVNSNCSF